MRLRLLAAACLALSAASPAPKPVVPQNKTALDRYVAAPDPSYKWEVIKTAPGDNYATVVLSMTSQTWRDKSEVDRPVWRHWLTLVKPDQVKSSTGFLYITGGNVDSRPPEKLDDSFVQMALATGSVVAELRMVPNEPLTFAGETKPRTEDGIIAYTWDKFLRGGDERWPLRLPMTKSAVRAMDTVTAYLKSEKGGGIAVDRFVVSGGSKRGWTTWTTAAVDRRVVAIVPFVIDLLNIEKSFDHHYRVYGFFAPAVKDYEEMRLMDWNGVPAYRALMKIEEPYEYRDRLTMPKFIVNSCGDQFFLPDSSQFYFDDLAGEKHLRYVPNTDHSLAKSDARESLHAFYEMVLQAKPRPKYNWKFEPDGSIAWCSAAKPSSVKLWQATNPRARDFRLMTIGPAWTSTTLEPERDGSWIGKVQKPPTGFTAYFVEATYPTGGKHPVKFTSGVRVLPDVEPHNSYRPRPPRRPGRNRPAIAKQTRGRRTTSRTTPESTSTLLTGLSRCQPTGSD